MNKKFLRAYYLFLVFACFLFITPTRLEAATNGRTQWAKSTVVGQGASDFWGATADSSGNTYAVGYISGNQEFDFGNDVKITGGFDGGMNAVIVKYNSSGIAQWANAVTASTAESWFGGASVDASGSIYVTGVIFGSDEFSFGNGVTISGGYGEGADPDNGVIVKYNSSGVAQWVASATLPPNSSIFQGITNRSGRIYVVGYISGDQEFNFGNGVTVSGAFSSVEEDWAGSNAFIISYNSEGQAQWAKSTTTGPSDSEFDGIAIDSSSGDIYAAGVIYNNQEFDFDGATVTAGFDGNSGVIVKYNSSGDPQWAKSTETATQSCQFRSVALDTSGNIYIVGEIDADGEFNFGNNVTVTGRYVGGYSSLLIKYNFAGNAQWAKTVTTASNTSEFFAVDADSSGVYAVGFLNNDTEFDFGNGVRVSAAGSGLNNALIVKYNNSGTAQWAKSTTTASSDSDFYGVASVDGDVYAVGDMYTDSQYGFGDNVEVAGPYADDANALFVKYTSLSSAGNDLVVLPQTGKE